MSDAAGLLINWEERLLKSAGSKKTDSRQLKFKSGIKFATCESCKLDLSQH